MGEGCYRCSKYMLVIFNFILLLLGCGLVAVGMWLRFDPNTAKYVDSVQDLEQYYIFTYVIAGCGALMILVGFIGCCGACCENQCLLCFYFLLLVCLFIVQVGGGVYIYFNKQEVSSRIEVGLTYAVKNLYGAENQEHVTKGIDSLQKEFMCCGARGPEDWVNSTYSEKISKYSLPDTCCQDMTKDCGHGKIIHDQVPIDEGIHTKGCTYELTAAMERNYVLIAGMVSE
ncbi:CD9 antigen-like isoform X2 [Ptychodera flava]|uniref:CD9 antigen-like isoform X2 n=1 Tax=Ptychodera flava TaxID=63121 RepID=UPI00396A6143